MNQYFNDKLSFFLTEVSFDSSEGKQLSYFQNGYFFKILWWCHELIIRSDAGKKIKAIFELLLDKKLNLNLYCFQLDRLYKHRPYNLAQKINMVRCSGFWPKKVHFEAKIGNFLIFSKKSSLAHENMKRNPK